MEIRWLVIISLLCVPSVFGATTSINTLGANNVLLLSSSLNGSCTDLDACDESAYTVLTEHAPYLADNVYTYVQDPSINRRSDGDGSQLAGSWYGVTDLGPGKWYLQVMFASSAVSISIIPYVNESLPSQNVSDWLNFSLPNQKQWYNLDVTSAVVKSFNDVGYIKLRIINRDTGSGKQVDEMFLIVPPGAGATGFLKQAYLQILPAGPTETMIDELVENEWNVVTLFDLGNTTEIIENPSCVVADLAGVVMNVSVNVTIDQDFDHLRAVWVPNSSLGFREGKNYQLLCDVFVFDVNLDELNQYVYVNVDFSFLGFFQSIVEYLLRVIGVVEQNQAYINETRDIANETLEIVRQINQSLSELNVTVNLGDNVSVQVTTVSVVPQVLQVFGGSSITVMSALSVGSVVDNNASCLLSVYYPNATKWIDGQVMSALGDDGLYTSNVSFGLVNGNYQAIVECSGGLLTSSARGFATWLVDDGVRMVSIT